ncbi:MAG: ATP-binding protein [Nitrospirales bacterium]|nr:hypothetical protein [Nitrospira sp.]MDR4502858.1 ATP-binding protein [Nitrospirales bacterium]
MTSTIIFSLTVALYVLAALFALRLIRETKKTLPWVLIGGALFLLSSQAMIQIFDTTHDGEGQFIALAHALVSLIISLFMVAGVALIAPLLRAYARNEQLREVLKDRTMVIQQHHEDQLRSLKQMQIALEVGKPMHMVVEQVQVLTQLIQEFLENMKSGLVVGNNFGIALQALIEEMTEEGELPVQLSIDPKSAGYLTKDQSFQLMHITREAVSNSQQHAKAKKARVSLTSDDKTVVLEVLDDGQGFEVDLVEAQGKGLGNMVARAKKIGARLKIKSKPKHGARVHVEIPIQPMSVAAET